MIERLLDFLTDIKTSVGTAAITIGSGVGQWIDMIPSNVLSKSATLVGIGLSIVLIVVHIRRDRREARRDKLELEQLRKKIEGAD
ncbi:hypothetical protein [Vibrio phage CKB-S1]|nr:hypothetical protein [Vibrio phage CKB-S1]